MQFPSPDLDRKVIPRWRSLARTPTSELENSVSSTPIDSAVFGEIRKRVGAWSEYRDNLSAQELVWASSVFGPSDLNSKALHEIVAANEIWPEIKDDAKRILLAEPVGQLGLVLDATNTRGVIESKIRELRNRIRDFPRDAIGHVELAMLYNRLGQTQRAERLVLTAFGLASSSRYIVRAASRFFVHIGDYDKAIRVLERGNATDPWVQASRVALYDLADRAVRDIKRIRELLASDLHPKHISELAGAIGTLDFKNGSVVRAKKLFRLASIEPSDNVVAQLYWASQQHLTSLRDELLRQSLTFEARTSVAQSRKLWGRALISCEQWLDDEPFSVRPANTGSYIAAEFMHDYNKSIEFCEYGRIANPNDFGLINNQAFSYAALGELDKAEILISEAMLRAKSSADKIVVTATEGMIQFRRGNFELGSERYLTAIDAARQEKKSILALSAYIHYVAEAMRLGDFVSDEEKATILTAFEGNNIPEPVRDIYNARLFPLLSTIDNVTTIHQPSKILEKLVL